MGIYRIVIFTKKWVASFFTSSLHLQWFSILTPNMIVHISSCSFWCSRHCSQDELHQLSRLTPLKWLPPQHVAHLEWQSRCRWPGPTAYNRIPIQVLQFQLHDLSIFSTSGHPEPTSRSLSEIKKESFFPIVTEQSSKTTIAMYFLTSRSFPRLWSGPNAWDLISCHLGTITSAYLASILGNSSKDFSSTEDPAE